MNHEELSRLATEEFLKGYNCAETIVVTLGKYLDRDDFPVSAATPFGAGFGGRRDMCGILVGGAMVMGVTLGRADPADVETKTKAYKLAGAYYRWFKERNGATLCRDIVPGKFTGHTGVCVRIMEEACVKVAELLEEPGSAA